MKDAPLLFYPAGKVAGWIKTHGRIDSNASKKLQTDRLLAVTP
jgi:hypothetical protein